MPAPLLSVLRIAFAALALYAMGTQLVIHLRGGFSVVNFFSYFTNLSNLLAAVVLLVSASGRFVGVRGTLHGERIRTISVANMIVVGVVFAVLLRNVDLGALLPWVNTVLHSVMPIVVVADWLLDPPARRLSMRDGCLCLVFPALYLVYTLLRGDATGWYPYPFLNPALVGSAAAVAGYALGIAITFAAVSAALVAFGNRRIQRLQRVQV